MKQDVIEYLVDSFIDYKGEEHKVVACSVSQAPVQSEYGEVLAIGWKDEDNYLDTCSKDFSEVCRIITVGISICNPCDSFDLEKGKKKAYNKALHDPKCPSIYTTARGTAGTLLVEAFLKQEIQYLKENPERLIKGYNKAKENYFKKETIKQSIENLSEDEKLVLQLAKKGVDIMKCSKLAALE